MGPVAEYKNQNGVFSFRSYLQAKITPFVSDFQQSDVAADLLAEFIVVLSMYREEGTDLFPAVFIGEDINEILSVTHGIDPIMIGSGPQTRETVRRAFKQSAPLAEGREWAAYVTFKKRGLSYGICRTDPSPVSPTPFERLRQNKNQHLKIIGLSSLGRSFIEVRSGVGLFQFVNMMGDHEEAVNPKEMIRNFMKAATQDAPHDLKSQLLSFYYRLGVDILHSNHGTLLAIIPHQKSGISKVVESCGVIVGYSCFIKGSTLESKESGTIMGGARRRAFDVLCSHLGKQLSGVIYKSQDGVVELGISNAN